MLKRFALCTALVMVAAGCEGGLNPTGPVNPDPDPGTTPPAEIVGTWVAKGADRASIMVELRGLDSAIITFESDGGFQALNYHEGAATPVTLTGTYTAGAGADGAIRSLTIQESDGTVARTHTGIYQRTGARLRTEVVQTTPAQLGVTAPTVAGGFGSSTILGDPTNEFIQGHDRR